MGLLIYKYEHLWQEVSVKSLILRWPLRPVGLLLSIVLHNLPLVATNLFPFFLDYAVVKGDASVSEIKFSMRTKIRALVRVLWEQKSWKTKGGSRGIGISVADTRMETIVTISLMTQNGHLFLKPSLGFDSLLYLDWYSSNMVDKSCRPCLTVTIKSYSVEKIWWE